MSIPNIETYRKMAQKRWAQEQETLRKRKERAWELARQAAKTLREQFGAQRVVAFGSLVREGSFHARSDIDLGEGVEI